MLKLLDLSGVKFDTWRSKSRGTSLNAHEDVHWRSWPGGDPRTGDHLSLSWDIRTSMPAAPWCVAVPQSERLCVTCLWVSSDPWWPCEWVGAIPSCPHQPRSAPVDSCLQLLPWSQSSSCLLFSCCLRFSPSITFFCQRPLPSHDVPESRTALVLPFLPPAVSGLICWRTHLFVFLAVQGIHRALHISNESVFPPSAFSTLQLLHSYVVVGNTRLWLIPALVSNGASLL